MRVPLIADLSPTVALGEAGTSPADVLHLETLHAVTSRTSVKAGRKALVHCAEQWRKAHALAKEKGQPAARALRQAQVAYKLALPDMLSMEDVHAYIACVAQGIAMEVFDGRDGSQLLYAAQVAISLIKASEGESK